MEVVDNANLSSKTHKRNKIFVNIGETRRWAGKAGAALPVFQTLAPATLGVFSRMHGASQSIFFFPHFSFSARRGRR